MATLPPQPLVILPLVDKDRLPANYWQDYLQASDKVLRALASGNLGPFVSAVNDADAARQGVAVNFIYESGGALRIRKV